MSVMTDFCLDLLLPLGVLFEIVNQLSVIYNELFDVLLHNVGGLCFSAQEIVVGYVPLGILVESLEVPRKVVQ